MLTKDPEERATVKELLAHKWFKAFAYGCHCASQQVVGTKARPPGNLLLRRLRLFVKMHEFKKEVCCRNGSDVSYDLYHTWTYKGSSANPAQHGPCPPSLLTTRSLLRSSPLCLMTLPTPAFLFRLFWCPHQSVHTRSHQDVALGLTQPLTLGSSASSYFPMRFKCKQLRCYEVELQAATLL
eukprot:533208-Pelagomonas_calceolata.AAC.7